MIMCEYFQIIRYGKWPGFWFFIIQIFYRIYVAKPDVALWFQLRFEETTSHTQNKK